MANFTFSKIDQQMMALAMQLARKGQFTTTPNPNVGCVIVGRDGRIVGQGWHQKAGTAHAEVHALSQAGDKALGATAYVTLEPCSHTGRTPPCCEALIQAKVKRVVAAMLDPNPLVSGNGLNKLTQAGIEVQSGLLQAQAEELNRGFLQRMRIGRPFVSVKLASTLDGKIALANGKSQWITGNHARRDVQRHRAQSCAILSGSGTVMADDPSLSVRYHELGEIAEQIQPHALRQPMRVILDGRNQLRADRKLFSLAGQSLVVNLSENRDLSQAGIQQWQAPAQQGKIDLPATLAHLATLGINDIWVEAGARLVGVLLQQKLVDELILYQAPKLIGDKGQSLLNMHELTDMSEVLNLTWRDIRQIGQDMKFTAKIEY